MVNHDREPDMTVKQWGYVIIADCTHCSHKEFSSGHTTGALIKYTGQCYDCAQTGYTPIPIWELAARTDGKNPIR